VLRDDVALPSLHYGEPDGSDIRIVKLGPASVGVVEGIRWEGVDYYIGTRSEIAAVKEGETEALWFKSFGYGYIAIAPIEISSGRVHAVEIAAAPGEGESRYLDLASGDLLQVTADGKPLGTPLGERQGAYGTAELSEAGAVVTTAEGWANARSLLAMADDDEFDSAAIDWSRESVLIYADAPRHNTKGLRFYEGFEDDQRVVLRLLQMSFQVARGGLTSPKVETEPVLPWGIAVVPRRDDKAYVVEIEHRTMTRSPLEWREVWRLEQILPPDQQLEALTTEN